MPELNKGLTFQDVEKVASSMIMQGVKPTVRGVIAVTGGKTESVSRLLRDFFDKRDENVAKMADEIGSSNIAKLIAGEIQVVVDRKNTQLSELASRQKDQINELIDLLEEKVSQYAAIKKESEDYISQNTLESNEKIEKARLKTQEALEAKTKAERQVVEIEQRAVNLVENAEAKASALVKEANSRAEQSNQEVRALREQVEALLIDKAKHDIERAEYDSLKGIADKLRIDLAEEKTNVVRFSTENKALNKDMIRLEADNAEYKSQSREFNKVQAQLIESQKAVSELRNELSLSERERESLSRALRGLSENKKIK